MRAKGYKHSLKTKEKMRAKALGRRMSVAAKEKISVANTGNIPWNKGKIGVYSEATLVSMRKHKPGHPHTEAAKQKIRDKLMGHVVLEEARAKMRGENNPNWSGGSYKNKLGYILIRVSDHPSKQIYVFEHRLMMEKHLGRYLTEKEVVHHLNGIKDDNRVENLMIQSQKTHVEGAFAKAYHQGYVKGFEDFRLRLCLNTQN